MTQLRYIAMIPIVDIRRDPQTGYGEVQRDEDGKPIYIGWRPYHTDKLYEKPGTARGVSNTYVRRGQQDGFGRVLVVDIAELEDIDANEHEQWQHAERMMFKWTAEEQRLREKLFGTHGKDDQSYEARVARTHKLRGEATVDVRRLLEAFKPPGYVIEVQRDHPVSDNSGLRQWPFVVSLRDARLHTKEHEQASDAHIFVCSETEGGAYAKLLAHILEGRGFFPMT